MRRLLQPAHRPAVMEIETALFAALGALTTVVGILWRRVELSAAECREDRKTCEESRQKCERELHEVWAKIGGRGGAGE